MAEIGELIRFAWPWAFAALPLPFIVRRLWRPAEAGTQDALRIPFYAALAELARPGTKSRESGVAGLAILIMVWVLLLVAAARPQRLGDAADIPVTGRDLMLAVDISGSMEVPDLVTDGQPATRLQVVQEVGGDFIARRAGDRVGLILFGKRAYLQTPLTFDRSTTRAMLDEAEIGLAGRETAIGDAIGIAVKHLRDLPQDVRVMVLLTDGANTAGELTPVQGADLAKRFGVRIYTIGVGADVMDIGAAIGSSSFNSVVRPRRINPSVDLDEKLLEYIAQTTGGRYFRARDRDALRDIYRELDELEPHAREDEVVRPVSELYYWPLGLALVVWMLLALRRVSRSIGS
jgi:Ca-activated chloride channel family protein